VPRLEGEAQRGGGLTRAGKKKSAARSAVEPVNGMDPLADRIPHAKESHVVVVIPTAVDEQPRRLVRHDDVLIHEEKLDRGLHSGTMPHPARIRRDRTTRPGARTDIHTMLERPPNGERADGGERAF
jgi:hypothetical protein